MHDACRTNDWSIVGFNLSMNWGSFLELRRWTGQHLYHIQLELFGRIASAPCGLCSASVMHYLLWSVAVYVLVAHARSVLNPRTGLIGSRIHNSTMTELVCAYDWRCMLSAICIRKSSRPAYSVQLCVEHVLAFISCTTIRPSESSVFAAVVHVYVG